VNFYVFQEFNKRHAKDVLISLVAYQVVAASVLSAGRLFIADITVVLSLTLAALLAAHIIRIAQISRSHDVVMTGMQISVTLVALLFIAFLVAYAYASVHFLVDGSSVYKTILLALLLASFFSIWIDFLIAHFVTKSARRTV
jgi:hypothetical protein